LKLRLFKPKIDTSSDEALLNHYQSSGDLQVLGLLYSRYTELVYGVCLKYFKQEEQASDAVMDIFEELISKAKKHEVDKFRPWLYVLAKNHCLMHLRKAGQNLTVSFDPGLMYSLEFSHPETETQSDREILLKKLENCVDALPEQQKECIRLFYFDDRSYKDIADGLNIDLNVVRSHIQNGRRNLKNCVGMPT
jgi:RNA polymerase sigma factor (sigma-70 family)